ncbi:hypothetical protein OROHE_000419 [Orobanche hederae]
MEGLEKLEKVQNTLNLLHSVGVSDANPNCERFLVDFTFLLLEMEGLEKLEKVQNTLNLLHSVGVSDANPNCERFLVDFTFLLMQPCGELDITLKCQLISKHLSKLTSLLSEGVSQCGREGCNQIENDAQIYCDEKTNILPPPSFHDDVAMVGIDAMMRSNSTLEDFMQVIFYVSQNGSKPASINIQIPAYAFVYRKLYISGDEEPVLDTKFVRMFQKDSFRPLLSLLQRQGLLNKRITQELRYGEEYWALERKLCCALESNKEICIEDVTRAIHLKSFDYRVLNLLLYQLRGEKVNELHMEFLSISELLVEVSDDLFDYEDDVMENNFNILRMFAKFYGASAAPIMMAKFITEAEEKYDDLSKALDLDLFAQYQQRCEEATKEGGKTCGPSLGTWHIPPVIEDENRYRTAFSSKTP